MEKLFFILLFSLKKCHKIQNVAHWTVHSEYNVFFKDLMVFDCTGDGDPSFKYQGKGTYKNFNTLTSKSVTTQ
jgi:hypothetical protein